MDGSPNMDYEFKTHDISIDENQNQQVWRKEAQTFFRDFFFGSLNAVIVSTNFFNSGHASMATARSSSFSIQPASRTFM